ncbi:hypothetical protein LVJ94_03785 [Pendulispora rubella]|uniref:Uncharacterized protein n=1 Tax=Pendulispora rubella TaxID=2741070 RepID=A0ABZ2L603_9BACT
MALKYAAIFAISLLGPALASPARAEPPAQQVELQSLFGGTFRYRNSPVEKEKRREAIERSIGGLFFVIRPMARSRLESATQVPAQYTFSFESGSVRVKVPGRPDVFSREDGTPAEYVYNDTRTPYTQRFVNGRLVQVFTFAKNEGSRINEFSVSPDGQTLTLKVTLSSSSLTAPLVYQLTYQRAGK